MAREMKDSGVKWIGEFPINWNVWRLKYVVDTVSEIGLNGVKIGLENIESKSGKFVPTDSEYEGIGQVVHKGEIVYGKLRPYLCKAWKAEFECNAVGDFYVFRCNPSGDSSFIQKVLVSNQFNEICSAATYGTKMPRVSLEYIKSIPIPLPPLSEQKAIADFLDKKCAEIDGLLADLEAEVKTLAEYKKSIIAETVTRGLNPNAPMKQSGIPWVGDMPSHWKVIANKYIMHKKKDIVPIYEGQDIISLSMNGVIVRDLDAGGKMPTTFNGYQHIYPGNLLMCLFDIDVTPRCIGLIKNDGLTSPAYSQFVMEREAYAPYYYYFYLKMDNDKELVHLSKNMRHSLNEEQFGMIKTIFPPREEQEAIATYLDEKCAMIDQSIADKQTQIETLKAYKSSLIYEYVTGKKQVI